LISSNNGWHDGWFYLCNDGDQLPRYSGRVLVSQEENWGYDIVEDKKPKLEPLLDVLWRLRQRGLTARMVAVAFHCRRVMPLTQRWLRLDETTPKVPLEGSRMSHESLPLDEVARRARWMVRSFRQEDIDRVLMHPTQGFEPLVSVILGVLEIFHFWIPSTNLVEVRVQDLSMVKETRPLLSEDRVAQEARASWRPRRKRRKTPPRSVKSARPRSRRR
jgi:hypothetical protein